MLVDQPMLHGAVNAVLVYIMIGSLIWMFVYASGRLARVYTRKLILSGSRGEALVFLGNALVTLILILGWPAMLIALRKGALR